MKKATQKNIGNSIGLIVVGNPRGVQNLLAKYKVVSSLNRKDLISKVVDNIDRPKFFEDFKALVETSIKNANPKKQGNFKNYTGDDFFANQSGGGSSFDWGSTVGGLLNLGGSIWQQSEANKLTKDQLKAQAQVSANELEKAKIEGQTALQLAQLQLAQQQSQKSQGNNTLLYAGLGIGGLLVVGLLFMALKKK